MCGIVGISFKNQSVNINALTRACDLLSHRGPNDSGIYISPDQKTGLGHRRLSFLDLSAMGKQPLQDQQEKLIVTFNGEIYNYLELKEDLEKKGHVFQTKTDTEVLLHGYKEWGKELPNKLEGMFSFGIYNVDDNSLFLARDRFGIKPMFYHVSESQFIFASEVKAMIAIDESLRQVRHESVSLFLANRYIPTPYTIWKNIFKLRPAHSLFVNLNDFSITEQEYWKLSISANAEDEKQVQKKFHELILHSIDTHLRSDVPIGSFLSGGYDSSALVYLMEKEINYPTKAFAIGFDDWEQSEDIYAKMVADATGAQLFISKPEQIHLDAVKKLMWYYDDPIADISIIPTYEVSKLAASQVKAVVSGEGADEALGGYWWHKPEKFIFKNKWTRFKNKFTGTSFQDIKFHYIEAMSMGLFDHSELQKALKSEYKKSIPSDPFYHFDRFKIEGISTIKQLQYLDLNTFMSELILTKVDRASMAHSLEVRVPFLDHNIMEYLFSLNEKCYTRTGVQKPLLRSLLQGKVPDAILNRPKQGFVGPDKYYMDIEMYSQELLHGRLVNDEVVDKNYILELVRKKDHWRLWKLFVLENWWRMWL